MKTVEELAEDMYPESGYTYGFEAVREAYKAGAANAEKRVIALKDEVKKLAVEVEQWRESDSFLYDLAGVHKYELDRLTVKLDEVGLETKKWKSIVDRIRATLTNAPDCGKYDADDTVSCGWKRDMQAVRMILEGEEQ